MTAISDRTFDWAERVSDRFNPILVREVLQALHGKVFVLCLATAVASITLIALGVVAFDADRGAEVFSGALMVLAPIVVFVVPLQAYMSMRHEVSGGSAEQLLMTGLTPRRIVLGKLAASLALFLLFLGVFAPLLALTYLLRGIDVPTIATMLFFTALASLAANAFAIAMAALGRVRLLGPVGLVGTIVGLGFGTMMCMIGAWELVRDIQRSITDPEFFSGCLGVTLGFGWWIWLFGALAAAVLAHEHENRSSPFRVFAACGIVLAFGWMAYAAPRSVLDAAGPGTAAVLAAILAPILLACACEREELSPRVARYVPRRRWLALLAVPFLPGGGRALVLVAGAAVLAIGAGLLVPLAFGVAPDGDEFAVAIASWSYLLMLCAFGRFVRGRLGPEPRRFWVALLAAALAFVFGMISSLIVLALGGDRGWSPLHVFNVPWTIDRVFRDEWIAALVLALAIAFLLPVLASVVRGIAEVLKASRARQRLEAADAA